MNHKKSDCPNANPDSNQDCPVCIPKNCEDIECVREKSHTGFHVAVTELPHYESARKKIIDALRDIVNLPVLHIGSRVVLSEKAIQNGVTQKTVIGVISGESKDERCWWVHWDGKKRSLCYAKEYVESSFSDQRDITLDDVLMAIGETNGNIAYVSKDKRLCIKMSKPSTLEKDSLWLDWTLGKPFSDQPPELHKFIDEILV